MQIMQDIFVHFFGHSAHFSDARLLTSTVMLEKTKNDMVVQKDTLLVGYVVVLTLTEGVVVLGQA